MKRNPPLYLNRGHGDVRIYHVRVNAFEIRYKVGGETIRETRKTSELARSRAEEVLTAMGEGGSVPTGDELQLYKYVHKKAAELGVGIMEVWNFWERSHRQTSEPLVTVITALLDDQRRRKVSKSTFAANVSRLSALVRGMRIGFKAENAHMDDIQAIHLDSWLGSTFANMTTRLNHRRACVQLWRWSIKKGYLADAQYSEADKTTVPQVPKEDPTFYTVKEMTAMFQWIEKNRPLAVPHVLLAGWCGIRNAEILRIKWGDLNLPNATVNLSSSITKTRRRRVVKIPLVVIAKLREWSEEHGYRAEWSPVSSGRYAATSLKIGRTTLDIPSKSNGLRKSFITHKIAIQDDTIAKVAESCGHSVEVLQSNYKGLVPVNEGVKWFAILQCP